MKGTHVMLETAETFYGPIAALLGTILPPDRHAEYILAIRRDAAGKAAASGLRPAEEFLEPASFEVAGHPIAVEVNHGRWIINCPGIPCGGAQVASRDDHRFFCVTCGNRFVDGRWLPVAWPPDPDGIVAALEPRPVSYQNWTGEPVDDLLANNADPINGLT